MKDIKWCNDNEENFNKENPVKEVFNSEPVAWIYERPNGSAKLVWVREPHDKSIIKEIPLYTSPQVELNDGGEPVKNATYWKRQYDKLEKELDKQKETIRSLNETLGFINSGYEVLYFPQQTKPLSDEEILKIAEKMFHYTEYKLAIEFARIVRGEK